MSMWAATCSAWPSPSRLHGKMYSCGGSSTASKGVSLWQKDSGTASKDISLWQKGSRTARKGVSLWQDRQREAQAEAGVFIISIVGCTGAKSSNFFRMM